MSPIPAGKAHDGPNKRAKGRLNCELLTCELGTVLDISASGLRVACGRVCPVRVGDTITLTLSAGEVRLPARMKVARVQLSGKEGHQIGLSFVDPTPGFERQVRDLAMICMQAPAAPRL